MKRNLPGALFVGLFVASLAIGAAYNIDNITRLMKGGAIIANTAGTQTSTNVLKKVLNVPAFDWDFASVTTTCDYSAQQTVTGAAMGDPCIASNIYFDGGSAKNQVVSCFVDQPGLVRFKACAAGTATDAPDASYTGVVLSFQ